MLLLFACGLLHQIVLATVKSVGPENPTQLSSIELNMRVGLAISWASLEQTFLQHSVCAALLVLVTLRHLILLLRQ